MSDPKPAGPVTSAITYADRSRLSWLPDTRAFLAISIVLIFGAVIFILLFRPVEVSDKVFGALAALLGVLTGCFKDVYGYSFGTTKDSGDKNQTIASQSAALALSTPVPPPAQT